jgi:hypothetical protein
MMMHGLATPKFETVTYVSQHIKQETREKFQTGIEGCNSNFSAVGTGVGLLHADCYSHSRYIIH